MVMRFDYWWDRLIDTRSFRVVTRSPEGRFTHESVTYYDEAHKLTEIRLTMGYDAKLEYVRIAKDKKVHVEERVCGDPWITSHR
jgi:hypothetical protein